MRERLKNFEDPAYIFSSYVHGDPATPVYKAYAGDRVIFRTMMPADKPRNVSLTIHGHLWREQPKDALSREIPLQGGISVGNRFDMELKGGAGCPGDYLYSRFGDIAARVNERLEEQDLSVEEAKSLLKGRAGLSDETIQFLWSYRFGDQLLVKLAEAIKGGS